MTELKDTRWVKVHEPEEANFESHANIMDILIGEECQADVIFRVPSYKKAVHYLGTYLSATGAAQILSEIAEQVANASGNKSNINLSRDERTASRQNLHCVKCSTNLPLGMKNSMLSS